MPRLENIRVPVILLFLLMTTIIGLIYGVQALWKTDSGLDAATDVARRSISDLSNGEHIVHACHAWAIREFGPSVRYWHHVRIFQQLCQNHDPELLQDLRTIYERARYVTSPELSDEQFERARTILSSLRSVNHRAPTSAIV
jgi:hypothetical protein